MREYGRMLRPHLVLFRGVPARGKATLARAVAARNRFPIVDRDILKASAARTHLDDSDAGELSYRQALLLAEQQLSLGLGVVVDGPFTRNDQLRPFLELGHAQNVAVRVIHCVADVEVLRNRIRQRAGQVAPVQWSGDSGVAKMTARLEEDAAARSLLFPQAVPGADLLVVDSAQPLERCLELIQDWLLRASQTTRC